MKPVLWDPANIFTLQPNVKPNICPSFLSTLHLSTLSFCTYTVLVLPLSLPHPYHLYHYIYMQSCMHSISHHHHPPSFWNMPSWRERSFAIGVPACLQYSIFLLHEEREREKGLANNRETESSKNRICYALVLSSHLYLSLFIYLLFILASHSDHE